MCLPRSVIRPCWPYVYLDRTGNLSSLWPLVSGRSFNAPPRRISIRSATTTCSHDAWVPRDWSGPWRVLNVSHLRSDHSGGMLIAGVNRLNADEPIAPLRPSAVSRDQLPLRHAPKRKRRACLRRRVTRPRVFQQISGTFRKKLWLPSLKRLRRCFCSGAAFARACQSGLWVWGGRKKEKKRS